MRHDPLLAVFDTAARQHGAVSRRQLLAAGVPRHVIDRRVRSGHLRPLHRGVYRVGPVAGPHAREMAAVLACGPGALVSHRSAASLWGLLPPGGDDAAVDLTVACSSRRERPGLRVHRTRWLPARDATERHGVPVTTPERTLFDLAHILRPRELERALAQGEREGLVERKALRAVVRQRSRSAGVPLLRALLERDDAPPAFTRSEAEERLLALVRRAQLGAPATNVHVEGVEVDFYWRAQRLVVEVDGYAFHGGARRFERDRRRDARLMARGLRIMRVTWRQLTEEAEAVVARLAQALAR
jgi:very-short-patch-repair endonuclease